MRELLQNAVDATLIRIWREHGEDANPKPTTFIKRDSAPRDETVRDILEKYPLDVKIEKENEEEKYNYWRITITDQGTGISRHDLEFLMSMGSSKKNHKKRAVVEKMPIWMKPSGIFGIGFHSVFLLTDEVIIETRSIDTGETLVIKLTSPTNNTEHGNIYFQIITKPSKIKFNVPYDEEEKEFEFKTWDFSRYGCQLSFIYEADKYTIPSHKLGGYIDQALKNYDAVIDESSDFYIAKIINDVSMFFNRSMFSWNFKFNEEVHEIESNYFNKNEMYYSPENELELLDNLFSANYPIEPYYRGQYIDDPICRFNLIQVRVNLLDDNADEILSINRNKFRGNVKQRNVKQEVFNRVGQSIQDFFKSQNGKDYYEKLDDNQKAMITAEYQLQDWLKSKPEYFSDWNQLLVNTKQGQKKIAELAESSVLYCNFDFRVNHAYPDDNDAIYMSKNDNNNYQLILLFLNNFKSVYIDKNECKIVKVDNKKTEQKIEEPISDDLIIWYCKETLFSDNNNSFRQNILKRQSIPCLNDYLVLALKNPNILPSLKRENFNYWIAPDFDLDLISPRMLFPLARIGNKITVGDLDILAKRVYKNRADEKTTVENIKMAYQKFIQMLDDLMKDELEWKELRGNEFNPSIGEK